MYLRPALMLKCRCAGSAVQRNSQLLGQQRADRPCQDVPGMGDHPSSIRSRRARLTTSLPENSLAHCTIAACPRHHAPSVPASTSGLLGSYGQHDTSRAVHALVPPRSCCAWWLFCIWSCSFTSMKAACMGLRRPWLGTALRKSSTRRCSKARAPAGRGAPCWTTGSWIGTWRSPLCRCCLLRAV